jgi:2-dehydropantoate 2-reductase
MLSYAILGTGALGGYYGARLAHGGAEVHFLLRSDFEHVQQYGLRVDSPDGDFSIPADRVQAYGDPTDLPPCDVAVVCLKTTQNDQLPRLLERCVKPDGVVLVLQNGYEPEADAAALVGPERVLGGLCFLCSNKLGPGHIEHQDFGHIHMGVYQPKAEGWPSLGVAQKRFAQVTDHFNRAGIDTTAVDDLRLSRWKKLVWNIPYNGLSVVLNQTTDRLMADPVSRRRVVRLMEEVQTAAQTVDRREISDRFIQKMLDYTESMTPYKTSMMLDHEAGRPLEIEAIVGDPLRAAESAGGAVPALRTLYDQLRSA